MPDIKAIAGGVDTDKMTMTTAAGQARQYRAVLTCENGDGWLGATVDQFGVWLRRKHDDVDLSSDVVHKGDGWQVDVLRHAARRANSLRIRLSEDKPDGRWTTEFMACDYPGAGDWLSLTVTNERGALVSVPNLAGSCSTRCTWPTAGCS